MIEQPKRKRRDDNRAPLSRERMDQENALDEALKAAEQPVSPGADRDRAKT
jgi:hypothetical protein